MSLKKDLIINWLFLLLCIILAILLWLDKFDVQNRNLDYTVHQSTLILRVINFILTAEIIYMVATFQVACLWYLIHRQTASKKQKSVDNLRFYDQGHTLLSALKGVNSRALPIVFLSLFCAIILIAGYLLDIFYIKAIYYDHTTSCAIQNTTIDMMSNADSSLSSIPTTASLFYAFGGYRILDLPNKNQTEINNTTYTVPAVGDTFGLQNYTSIKFNVSVSCQNPEINKTEIKSGRYVTQAGNGSFLYLPHVSPLTKSQVVISAGSASSEMFISVSGCGNSTDIIGVPFGDHKKPVATARCHTNITYSLVNDNYDWGHTVNDTSARDIATRAQRASLDLFSASFMSKNVTSGVATWLTNNASIIDVLARSRTISLKDYETKLSMIALAYLQGSGVNGTMSTMGYYCQMDMYASHIRFWYKLLFTLIQVVTLAFLALVLLRSSGNKEHVHDTPTLIDYIHRRHDKPTPT